MEVSLATTPEELQEVYSLRYQIYIEELGKTFIQHDAESRIMKDELDDSAFHICLRNNGELIGMVRLRYPKAGDKELSRLRIPIELQQKYNISVSSRMMLRKENRSSTAMLRLMNFTYDKCIRDGIHIGIIEVEKHLVETYKKFGFHEIGTIINEYQLERTLMFVNGRDYQHFKEIASPYSKVFLQYVEDINQDTMQVKLALGQVV